MLLIVAPVFMVILVGYGYGRMKAGSGCADKLINDYVLYIALPALLFIAVARADVNHLKHWGFILSTLTGIVVTYVVAGIFAKAMGTGLPQSSILSMGASYGTTGYMGVPILISVYGQQAALPAALATILHNIPVIMAVIISWDIFSRSSDAQRVPLLHSVGGAALTSIKNSLTIAVLAGLAFSIFRIQVPVFLETFTRFLGNASGPTALFALGLGLSRLNFRKHLTFSVGKSIFPMIVLKLVIQPAITFTTAICIFHMGKEQAIWLATAVVMAAQPIGAGVYIFAKKYNYEQDVISLSIVVSLLLSLITIPLMLELWSA